MSIKQDTLHNAQQLLFQAFDEYQHEASPQAVLVIEDNTGYIARQTHARFPEAQIDIYLKDYRRAIALSEHFYSNEKVNVHFDVISTDVSKYDAALLTAPKGRFYTRKHFVACKQALKDGKPMFLVGQTKLGAKSIVKDAIQYFGQGETLIIKKHCRVGVCLKAEQSKPTRWQDSLGLLPNTYHEFEYIFHNQHINHYTLPGVFSWEHLDSGTEMLLDHLKIKDGQKVWDIGCGSGVIGLAAAQQGADHVYMSDVDMLALTCAWRNAKEQGLLNQVTIGAADATKSFTPATCIDDAIYPKLKFDSQEHQLLENIDLIVTNPPFHQGHEQNLDMMRNLLDTAKPKLAKNGRILIVANTFLPYAKMFKQTGYISKTLERTPSFSVHEACLQA